MARLVIENLTKIFRGRKTAPVHAVDRACLALEDHEFLVLAGPSGCGKSTLLRLVAGLEEITEGTISIDGVRVNSIEPKDRDIAMVFQGHALYPHMTAYENLAFGLTLRKTPKPEIERRVREAAEMLELQDCLTRLPQELSGGERQRVAVGRALVRQPKIFLFDEPFSNLDARLRAQMRRELARLHARLPATMIYVTHDQTEAMTMGHRLAVMKHGVIGQVDAPLEVYRRPKDLFTAGFIGAPPINLLPGTFSSRADGLWYCEEPKPEAAGAVEFSFRTTPTISAEWSGAAGKRVLLGLRPESLRALPANPNSAGEPTLIATVDAVESLGHEAHLFAISLAGHPVVARVPSDFNPARGEKISLVVDLQHASFFDPATGDAMNLGLPSRC